MKRTKYQPYFGYHSNQIPTRRKKFLQSFISPSIKEVGCSDSWKFVVRHCSNGSYHIKCVDFYQSYIPVAHSYSFRINIDIADMHILTARVLDVSNFPQKKYIPIPERVYVSPTP